MAISRENFVEFLNTRLTKESAKSYLSYVDAFSRAVKKDDQYFFSNLDQSAEVKTLLQGGIDKQPIFQKHSKKFQSNIKTGIRALLKYYLFIQDQSEKKIAKIPEGMTPEDILEHYTYSYRQWLKNRLIKMNGEHFKSYEAYANGLRYAIIDSNVSPKDFFSYTKKMQIDIFQIQLGDKRNFQGRTSTSRADITSSLNKYKLYLAERFGEKSTRLY
jgi:hypothetical protein